MNHKTGLGYRGTLITQEQTKDGLFHIFGLCSNMHPAPATPSVLRPYGTLLGAPGHKAVPKRML